MTKTNVLYLFILISSFLFYINTLRINKRFRLSRTALANSGLSNAVGYTLLGIAAGNTSSSLFARPKQNTYPSPLSTINHPNVFNAVKKEEQRLAAIRAAKLAAAKNASKLTNQTNSTKVNASKLVNATSSRNKTNSTKSINSTILANKKKGVNKTNNNNNKTSSITNRKTNNKNQNNKNKTNASSISPVIAKRVRTTAVPTTSPVLASSSSGPVCGGALHTPYPKPETKDMKNLSIIIVLIFGTLFLIFRYLLSFKKKISDNFILSMIKVLSQQLIMYFFLVGLVLVLYTFGILDDFHINWQFLISAFCIFGICWFFFCFFIIILSNYLSVLYWRNVEKSSKDLKNLKDIYDAKANEQYSSGKAVPQRELVSVFELYEYNILKTYFCNPFYPVFKASNLRKDFNFALYLEYCLSDKIRLFVKLSWTCWIFTIICVFIWQIFIVDSAITFNVWFLTFLPIAGILLSVILHFYIKSIYRNVVVEVDQINYMNFLDIGPNDFGIRGKKIVDYPKYIDSTLRQHSNDSKSDNIDVSQFNFNKLYHSRPPSIYEDLIIFGTSGFYVLINIIQMIGFMFIIWSILFFFKEYSIVISVEGNWFSYFFISLFIFYIIIFALLLTINIKWYTIISSIEMKRDENRIKKVVNQQLFKAGEMAEKIYNCFKRLWFDMKINEKNMGKVDSIIPQDTDLGLTKNHLIDLVKIAIKRFKNIPKRTAIEGSNRSILTAYEDYPFSINEELRPFLKTCGNDLTNREIEHLLHFIEKIEDSEFSTLTSNELYDLHTMTIFFSNNLPQKIISYVLDKFFDEENTMLTCKMVEDFMIECKYFTQDQIDFVKDECTFMDKEFSKDAFIHMIVSLRRYFPY